MIMYYYYLLTSFFILMGVGRLVFKYKITPAKVSIVVRGTYNYWQYKYMNYCLRKWGLQPIVNDLGVIIPYMYGVEKYNVFVENSKRRMKPMILKAISCKVTRTTENMTVTSRTHITEDFVKFMGHNKDIIPHNLTPRKIGYDEGIEVTTVMGKKHIFAADELIKV